LNEDHGHGHGHNYGVFVLATHPEGTKTTNPDSVSPSIPAQALFAFMDPIVQQEAIDSIFGPNSIFAPKTTISDQPCFLIFGKQFQAICDVLR
jgi:hypothetical protein